MLSFASLLRLLLALSLVFTTSAGAAQAVRMHLAMAPAPTSALAEAPCHGDTGAAATTLHSTPALHHAEQPAPSPKAPMDCCQSGQCDGICLLSLPPLPTTWAMADAPPPADRPWHAAPNRHVAPRLARPQRPPIA